MVTSLCTPLRKDSYPASGLLDCNLRFVWSARGYTGRTLTSGVLVLLVFEEKKKKKRENHDNSPEIVGYVQQQESQDVPMETCASITSSTPNTPQGCSN